MEKVIVAGVSCLILGLVALIFIKPLGIFLIVFGAGTLIFAIYAGVKSAQDYKKKKEDPPKTEELAPLSSLSSPSAHVSTASGPMIFTRDYSMSGIDKTAVMEYAKKNPDIEMDYDSIKDMYDRGEKIYEYDINIDNVDVQKTDDGILEVFKDGKKIGKLSKTNSDACRKVWNDNIFKAFFVEGHVGRFMKVEKNDSYDPDMDDEYEKNWVEWDELSSPKMRLFIKVEKRA